MNGTISGSLLIIDATGCIGRALVDEAVKDGRPVVAVALDYPALQQLKTSHPGANLTLVPGSTRDDASSEALAADLRELGRPFAGVLIASCVEPIGGRVLSQPSAALGDALSKELLPQLAAARALLPLLADAGRNGTYVVIGGPGSEQPWAGYGQRSVSAAATRMLLRVLHEEARTLSVRVQLLAVDMPARTEENAERACAQWPSAHAVAARALELVDRRDNNPRPEAVVRFAWNATPPPISRVVDRRNRAASASLEDTWNQLKPLLTTNNKKAPQA